MKRSVKEATLVAVVPNAQSCLTRLPLHLLSGQWRK
jgi:hypothetical protein